MQGLEQLITRIKQRAMMGQAPIAIAQDFLAQGMDEELVFWAMRAAEFEMVQDRRKENA